MAHLNKSHQHDFQQETQSLQSDNESHKGKLLISKAPSLISRETSISSISKHYALNNLLLNAFEHLRVEEKYHVAYAVGMKFVETAILEIPKHGYFFSTRHDEERIQSSNEAYRVVQILQEMIEKDESLVLVQEEEAREHDDKTNNKEKKMVQTKHMQQLAHLAEERGRNDSQKSPRNQEMANELENELYSICGNIWTEYSDLLLSICTPKDISKDDLLQREIKHDQGMSDIPNITRCAKNISSESSTRSIDSNVGIDRALYLSGLQITHPFLRQSRESNMPMSSLEDKIHDYDVNDLSNMTASRLSSCYQNEFAKCLNFNKIQLHSLATFQGRINGSTNGCTVIAPLLCISFFKSGKEPQIVDSQYLGGLSDEAISEVIDVHTSEILPKVRKNLGLGKDTFIIPSDVHDFLIEKKFLLQNQFVTVVGGNILNDQHLNELIDALKSSQTPSLYGKRIGATLFFHEHVIAIHRIHRVSIQDDIDNSQIWFDLIDSLPHRETFTHFQPYPSEGKVSDWEYLNSFDSSIDGPIPLLHNKDKRINAIRIRCFDVDSLRVALRWFACSKFSDSNCAFIDKYPWEDSKSDFDPRVFQAFVWSSTD